MFDKYILVLIQKKNTENISLFLLPTSLGGEKTPQKLSLSSDDFWVPLAFCS